MWICTLSLTCSVFLLAVVNGYTTQAPSSATNGMPMNNSDVMPTDAVPEVVTEAIVTENDTIINETASSGVNVFGLSMGEIEVRLTELNQVTLILVPCL